MIDTQQEADGEALRRTLEARGWPARPLTGEPPAVDALNTRWLTGTDSYDLLDDDELTRAWLDQHGLHRPDAALPDVRRRLREARSVLAATVADAGDLTAVNGLLDHGRIKLSLTLHGQTETAEVGDPARHAAFVCARDFARLITDAPGRVRKCANPPCPLHFTDTSRKGERRWCSMSLCGNRAKAQRHRDRLQGSM
ncbi:CGNR zinc finger domain-containing protein [Streptomyces sp. NPDC001380]|uniref:CGNR zinc finger domain-containing protein n=1 Tax=Streptomyces sp. NPDC001380 TaxID=3364566 RepID=UPI0036B35F81